jgi:Uma2 family endonuclease
MAAESDFVLKEFSGPVLTYDEFLSRAEVPECAEWVKGRVVEMSPVTEPHESIRGFLYSIIKAFVEIHRLGRVYSEPFQMKTGRDLPGRSPDVFFVADANKSRVRRLYLDGPADLIVEVISPGSRATDRGDKFREYEQGGVPEYWLIDPDRKQAEFYFRGDDGSYKLAPISGDGIYHSKVLSGLWLQVSWLWQALPPPLLDVLKHWKLV